MSRLTLLLSACVVVWSSVTRAEDWPCFRGPNRDGTTTEKAFPLKWSKTENIKWKFKLPSGGNSSPVVVGDKLFLTCAEDKLGQNRSLFCINIADGTQVWKQTVNYTEKEPTHGTNPYCASTPFADKERVVVWHGSAGLYCYDHAGKELWKLDLGTFRHIWGYASSPLIHGENVYLSAGPGDRSSVVAVNKNTGQIAWMTKEPTGADDKSPVTKGWIGSWSTPVIVEPWLVLFQPTRVNGYDLASGRIVWTISGTGPLAYSDVMINCEKGIGIAMAGYGGNAIGFKVPQPKEIPPVAASGVNPPPAFDATATHRLWQSSQKPPQRIGSGVFRGEHLYMPSEPGLSCFEVATGKEAWNEKSQGSFWGSIVATPDRLYITNQGGKTIVFEADPSGFKLLASNAIGEKSNSTPALSNGRIYIRTYENLYCIGE